MLGALQEYKATNSLKSISSPAQSHDLNIIENIWLHIKKLAHRHHVINSYSNLFTEIQRFWMEVKSMQRSGTEANRT